MTATLGIRKSIWTTMGIALLVLLAMPFAIYSIEKGFQFSSLEERALSRLFDASAIWASGLIYLHMVSGGVITVLAPLQMVRGIRSRWPKAHHVCGYAIATIAIITALSGLFYISRQGTIGGPLMSTGFAIYGGLMLLSAVQTVRYARQRHSLHSLWAGRLIILALASWLYRVHYGIWEVSTGGVASYPDFSGIFDQAQVFAFYVPYLAVHHICWHARSRLATSG